MSLPTSCGTLIINQSKQLLLCHITNTEKWDILKGMQDPGEPPLEAAMRELYEESSLKFEEKLFEEIGSFDYRKDKRLHLFKVYVENDLKSLDHLVCTSYFPHHVTGKPTPEVDGFRWASRKDIAKLCWPRMAQRLLSLDW